MCTRSTGNAERPTLYPCASETCSQVRLRELLPEPVSAQSGCAGCRGRQDLCVSHRKCREHRRLLQSQLDEIEGDVRYKIGGTIHIGYFAIDEKFQHQLQATTPNGIHLYWGDVLLEECLSRIEAIRSQQVGVSFVTLASSEAGERLYRHHDFEDLDADITFSPSHGEDKCICLYLPLDY